MVEERPRETLAAIRDCHAGSPERDRAGRIRLTRVGHRVT
jgi:hypothetical protein